MWISVVLTHRRFCYSTFKVLTSCRLRCQSIRVVKTDIRRQTFRFANFPSEWVAIKLRSHQPETFKRRRPQQLIDNDIILASVKRRQQEISNVRKPVQWVAIDIILSSVLKSELLWILCSDLINEQHLIF